MRKEVYVWPKAGSSDGREGEGASLLCGLALNATVALATTEMPAMGAQGALGVEMVVGGTVPGGRGDLAVEA